MKQWKQDTIQEVWRLDDKDTSHLTNNKEMWLEYEHKVHLVTVLELSVVEHHLPQQILEENFRESRLAQKLQFTITSNDNSDWISYSKIFVEVYNLPTEFILPIALRWINPRLCTPEVYEGAAQDKVKLKRQSKQWWVVSVTHVTANN